MLKEMMDQERKLMTMFRNTMTFCQVYDNPTDFSADYKASGLYDAVNVGASNENLHNSLSDANISVLFYLLIGKYADNPIANASVEIFKQKMFGIIFQYGPTWQKRLDIQDKFRNLTESQILTGTKTVFNHAYNNASLPSAGELSDIPYIDEQQTQATNKAQMSAYNELLSLLETNVTKEFIDRFMVCFNPVVCQTGAVFIDDEEEC